MLGRREFLAAVPDLQDPRGVRHSLVSVLLASVASVLAVTVAGRDRRLGRHAPRGVAAALGARSDPLAGRRLTASDIRALITSLGDLRDVIRDATPAEKTAIYDQFGLKITLKPGQAKIRAEVTIGPEKCGEHAEQCGDTGRVRGGIDPIPPYCSISNLITSSAEINL